MLGGTQFTRMPDSFASVANPRQNIAIAAIAAPMATSAGVATSVASEAMQIIEPDCCAIITGSAARVGRRTPDVMEAIVGITFSIGISCISRGIGAPPAQLTRTSIRPNQSTQAATDASDPWTVDASAD